MKILIEEQYYPADKVGNLCGDFGKPNNTGEIKVSGVGYFFNKRTSDCIICLPKAIMFKENDEYKAFGKFQPNEILDVFSSDIDEASNESKLEEQAKSFIKDFALWSYRTISTYARLNPKSDIVYKSGSDKREEGTLGTLLDVILALIKFYNENKDYFMYVIKNIHSGYNRVNWRKTISRKTPIMQDSSPIYIDVINRRKQINFDEELMIIFYSILNYLAKHLGFEIRFECNYDLITGYKFEAYMEELGLIRLRAIKYKYFSDKDLQMWNLCHAFFKKTCEVSSSEDNEDYLFVTDFDKVFESMMDALISDSDVHKKLVNQKDGKIVDHIFMHESPIDKSKVYYIGDSKYYKTEDDVKGTALYKQHTYAKNVIQFHIDRINNGEKSEVVYRDDITEGYAFAPNFFISAYIPNDLSYERTDIGHRSLDRKDSMLCHFPNRLFDRDTLLLHHYDVNLLYVMSLYARDDGSEQSSFRTMFRNKVQQNFTDMLANTYEFFWVAPKEGQTVEEFVRTHFHKLIGRAYIPYEEKGRFLMALEWDGSKEKTSSKECIEMKKFLREQGATISEEPSHLIGRRTSSET